MLMEQTWSQSNAELLPTDTVKQLLGDNSVAALVNSRMDDLWLADDGTEVLGVLGVTPEGYVWACYVRSDRQRQGVGKALMSAAEDHFRSRGAKSLSLDIIEGNSAAEAFYASQGWMETSRRTESLPGHTATSVQLSLIL